MVQISYIPQAPDVKRKSKGNGGNSGCMAGHHKNKSVANNQSLLYGDGCFVHGIITCSKCPLIDCNYDYSKEYKIQKELRELIQKVTNGNKEVFDTTWDYISEYKLKDPVVVTHIALQEMNKKEFINERD